MWFPTPIYERIPHFWLLLGILFVGCAPHIGMGTKVMYTYAILGIGCWIHGFRVWIMRARYRREKELQDAADAATEQQPEPQEMAQPIQH